jgi:hypothetical protein
MREVRRLRSQAVPWVQPGPRMEVFGGRLVLQIVAVA